MSSDSTYASVLKQATERLQKSGVEDAKFDARCLLSKASGKSFNDLMFLLTDKINPETEKVFESFVFRREKREPLQYIIGEWDFFGLSFYVGKGVLIPRPETEFLVETAIERTPENGVVYDVCAGSGCIGISVAEKRRDVTVYLFEKYDSPYFYLTKNIERHGLDNVIAVRCDMTNGVPNGLKAPDVILSNPPYIETSVLETLQEEVKKEPLEALDGGQDGYDFYKFLSKDWFSVLNENGIICMECGENMPQTVAKIFEEQGGIAETFKDMYGIERFVTVINRKGRIFAKVC